MEILDYELRTAGLWVIAEVRQTASLETVAAVLQQLNITDGYSRKNGEDVCICDGEAVPVWEVWQTIGGELQEQVAKKCLQ